MNEQEILELLKLATQFRQTPIVDDDFPLLRDRFDFALGNVLARLSEYQETRPKRVCLCGSTRFADAYRDANRDETLAGRIVLSVGLLGHQEGLDMNGPVKVMLDELHLWKIDLADEVLVLNVDGYVGESTRREIAYATATGKKIRYLNPTECKDKP